METMTKMCQKINKWLSYIYDKLGGPEKSPVRIEIFDTEEYKPSPHTHQYEVKDAWFKSDDGTVKVPLGDVSIVNSGIFMDTRQFEGSKEIPWLVEQKQTISLTTQDVEMAKNFQPGQEFEIAFPNSEEKVKKGWPEKFGLIVENAFLQSVSLFQNAGGVFQAALELVAYPKYKKPKPVHYAYKNALRWKNRQGRKFMPREKEVDDYDGTDDYDPWEGVYYDAFGNLVDKMED